MQFYEYTRDTHRHPVCWESDNPNCYPHFHKSMELVYVVHGRVLASMNGRDDTVGAGQLLIIPGYTIHSLRMMDQTKTWVCTMPQDVIADYKQVLTKYTFSRFIVDFSDTAGEEAGGSATGDGGTGGPEGSNAYDAGDSHVHGICGGNILVYFEKIRQCLERKDTLEGRAFLTGYAYLILGSVIEAAGLEPVKNTKMAAFPQEVLSYLDEHYLDNCDLEEISGHFGYSKSRFSHIFNEVFGCRLVEYVNGLRCAHALSLMEDGTKTITDIALASGFETTRTFYRAFRKCYGVAPGDFAVSCVS